MFILDADFFRYITDIYDILQIYMIYYRYIWYITDIYDILHIYILQTKVCCFLCNVLSDSMICYRQKHVVFCRQNHAIFCRQKHARMKTAFAQRANIRDFVGSCTTSYGVQNRIVLKRRANMAIGGSTWHCEWANPIVSTRCRN